MLLLAHVLARDVCVCVCVYALLSFCGTNADREVEEMELPIADYRDHSNITIRGAQIPRGVDGQVDAPSEPPAADYDDDKAAASQTDAHSAPTRYLIPPSSPSPHAHARCCRLRWRCV
jgi:hypothetical protein